MYRYVIADHRVSDLCSARLAGLGHVVIRLPCFWGLDAPVSAHPDLLLFRHGREILTPRAYYEANRRLFDALPVCVVPIESDLSGGYPKDVALDALAVGETLYGKAGAVDQALLDRYKRFVPVKQGYTRCSVALLGQCAAMTADSGIADALEKDGLTVLRIRPGHIALPGYDCGLIGGASGDLGDGKYGFFGDPLSHPDGKAMVAFLRQQGWEPVCLEEGRLVDRGGLCLIGSHEE